MRVLQTFITAILVTIVSFVPSLASPHDQAATPMTSDDLPKFLISNIQNSQRIEVAYSYQGCFSSGGETLIFTPSRVNVKNVGQKDLTWTEMASLDRYIAAVANISDEDGICTTTSDYILTLYQNDVAVMKKRLSDTACISGESMMEFGAIAYKMKSQNESAINR